MLLCGCWREWIRAFRRACIEVALPAGLQIGCLSGDEGVNVPQPCLTAGRIERVRRLLDMQRERLRRGLEDIKTSGDIGDLVRPLEETLNSLPVCENAKAIKQA
jgi:hypothetical protein